MVVMVSPAVRLVAAEDLLLPVLMGQQLLVVTAVLV